MLHSLNHPGEIETGPALVRAQAKMMGFGDAARLPVLAGHRDGAGTLDRHVAQEYGVKDPTSGLSAAADQRDSSTFVLLPSLQ